MTEQDRIRQLDQQIAHLKVLAADTQESIVDDKQNVAAWTKRLMVHEAALATFAFRIEEFDRERQALTRRHSKRETKT